jgi:NADH dehydrogenase FAD-containing subunit
MRKRERNADLRDRTRLVFATAADGPFPMTGFFNECFERFGIESLVYAPVRKVDNRNRRLIFGEGRDGRTVEPIHFDLLMAPFPLAAHRAFEPLCDDTGLIPSHPRTMKTQWDGVCALGDCNAMRLASDPLHPKAGAFAICQAQALAENIQALVRSHGRKDNGAENLAIAQCDAEVGYTTRARIVGPPTASKTSDPTISSN